MMSYPRDLDEISQAELEQEITRRILLRIEGKCDYCERPVDADPCRFPERHRKNPPPFHLPEQG